MKKRLHGEVLDGDAKDEQKTPEGSGSVKRFQTHGADGSDLESSSGNGAKDPDSTILQFLEAAEIISAPEAQHLATLAPSVLKWRSVLLVIGNTFSELSKLLIEANHNKSGQDKDRYLFFLLLLSTTNFINHKLCSIHTALYKALDSTSNTPLDPKIHDFESQFRDRMVTLSTETQNWSSHLSRHPEASGTAFAKLIRSSKSLLTKMMVDFQLGTEDSFTSATEGNPLVDLWKSTQTTFSALSGNLEKSKYLETLHHSDRRMLLGESTLLKEVDRLLCRSSVILEISSSISNLLHEYRRYQMDLRNPYHQLLIKLFTRSVELLSGLNSLLLSCIDFRESTPTNHVEADFQHWYELCLESARDWSAEAHAEVPSSELFKMAVAARKLIMELIIGCCTQGGQLNIGYEEMDILNGLGSDFVPELQARVLLKRIDFPWKRYTMGDPMEKFNNLREKSSDPNDVRSEPFVVLGLQTRVPGFFPLQYQGRTDHSPSFFALDSPKDDYNAIDVITDYFQERQRMEGRLKNADLSPMEFWLKNGSAAEIFRESLRQNPRELLAKDVREIIFKRVKECTQFKVTLVKGVIEKLNGTRMLDFSAGWGDRLVGAIGTGSIERYVGVDPNTDLKPGHDEIIRTLAPLRTSKFTVIYEPFQTARLPVEDTFDLVFTSPPYFDFEIYTHRPGQSVLEFPRFDLWLVHFLFVSLQKAWKVLDVGGHLAIHITDTRDAKCCEAMNLFIQSRLPGSVYEGIIGSYGQRKDVVRPIWVWRKEMSLNESQSKRKSDAEQHATKHYHHIWKLVNPVLGSFTP